MSNETLDVRDKSVAVFLYSGLLFLLAALLLFLAGGWILFSLGTRVPLLGESSDLSETIRRFLSVFSAPLILFFSALLCAAIGRSLLSAAGVVTKNVIPPRDAPLLEPAIANGNTLAVSEYIRLSSLAGITGTFTKLGLTGLPLATISLTVLLAFLSLLNERFYDLAQLTLGAFLGSYVQKQRIEESSAGSIKDGVPIPAAAADRKAPLSGR